MRQKTTEKRAKSSQKMRGEVGEIQRNRQAISERVGEKEGDRGRDREESYCEEKKIIIIVWEESRAVFS